MCFNSTPLLTNNRFCFTNNKYHSKFRKRDYVSKVIWVILSFFLVLPKTVIVFISEKQQQNWTGPERRKCWMQILLWWNFLFWHYILTILLLIIFLPLYSDHPPSCYILTIIFSPSFPLYSDHYILIIIFWSLYSDHYILTIIFWPAFSSISLIFWSVTPPLKRSRNTNNEWSDQICPGEAVFEENGEGRHCPGENWSSLKNFKN